MKASKVSDGRPATNAAVGLSKNGGVLRNRKDRAEFATAEQYQEIRGKLSSNAAREVLDELTRWESDNKAFFLWTEVHEIEVYCNSHARYRQAEKEVAELRARGEDIPMQLTKRLAEGETMQYAGLYILHKQASEDRRTAGNALALTKLVQAKVAEDIKAKQMSLFDDDEDGVPLDDMTLAQMEAEIANSHGIAINIADARAARAART